MAKPTKVVRLKVKSHALSNLIDRSDVTYAEGNDFNTIKEAQRQKSAKPWVSAPGQNKREPPDKAHMELPFLLEPDTLVKLILFDSKRVIPWFSDGLQNRAVTAVMDYLEHDNGRTITTEQTLHIYYTIRVRPGSAHPMDALRQMRGWLEAWHNFYSLKKDKTCIDKIEELQAIVQYVTNPIIKLDKRKEASDQFPGALVGRELNIDLSDSETASTDTLMADEYVFEPQIPQKVAGHTSGDTQSPVSALTFQDTDIRANEDVHQAVRINYRGNTRTGLPSLKASNVTDTPSEFLSRNLCRETGVPRSRATHPDGLVSRNVEDRVRANLGEGAQDSCLDAISNLPFERGPGDRTRNGNGMSAGWEPTDLFLDMGHGRNRDFTDQRHRHGISMRAPINSQQVGVVTGGVPDPQRAENRFQNIYPLPPGYLNFEDPFGRIHKIVMNQQLQCDIEGLVALECCRFDPGKVQLVTSQHYELYTLAGSALKPCIRITDIVSGDYVKMRFKA